jgi:hypothetical protein
MAFFRGGLAFVPHLSVQLKIEIFSKTLKFLLV